MPLHPTDEQWRATIAGAPHLSCEFWLPAGCDEDQARMRAWEIWSLARASGSTAEQPMARLGLQVERVAATFTEIAALGRAA